MAEPKTLSSGDSKPPKPRREFKPGLWIACGAAAAVPILILAWVLGAPPKPEGPRQGLLTLAPPRDGLAPGPKRPEAPRKVAGSTLELAKPPAGAAKPGAPAAGAAKTADAAGETEEPAAAEEIPPEETGAEPGGLQAPPAVADAGGAAFHAGGLQPISPFASGQGGGGGAAGSMAAGGPLGPAAGRAVEPPANPRGDGPVERLRRGFTAIGRALSGKGPAGGGTGERLGGVRNPQGQTPVFSSTNSNSYQAQPGGGAAITDPGAAAIGGAGATQPPPYAGPANGGGLLNPEGNGAIPPPDAGGPFGPQEAGQLEDGLATQSQMIRRTVTKPLVEMLDGVMKKYKPQVDRAVKSIDKLPDLAEAIDYFGKTPHEGFKEIHDDLVTFQWFLVTDKDKQAPPEAAALAAQQDPAFPEAGDLGLRARLEDTQKLIAGMGTCLADFKAGFPKSDKGKTTKKKAGPKQDEDPSTYKLAQADVECVDQAERALRRRAQPGIGFIPVSKAAMKVLNGTADGKGKGKMGLQARYDALKKREKTDPAAKEAAAKLLKALKAANSAIKGVLTAFKTPPYKPGPKDEKPRDAANGRARDLQKIGDGLRGRNLPKGEASVQLPLAIANAIGSLDNTSLGLSQGMVYPGVDEKGVPGPKKYDPVNQFALAAQNAVHALWDVQLARGWSEELHRQAAGAPR